MFDPTDGGAECRSSHDGQNVGEADSHSHGMFQIPTRGPEHHVPVTYPVLLPPTPQFLRKLGRKRTNSCTLGDQTPAAPIVRGGHDWGNVKVERASERLLTPGEVASLFRVDPKTVTRWAASGRISSIRTPGGHRRFRESEVRALLLGEPSESAT